MRKDPALTYIELASIYGMNSQQGLVELTITQGASSLKTQLTLDKAREIHQNLGGAIEAAVSDELLYRFLREKVGMAADTAARALLDFRELRQGSFETVYPS